MQASHIVQNLLLATKAPAALAALTNVQPLLSQNCNIMLLQNGLPAVYEEVQERFLRSQRTQLQLFLGSVTHGCYKTTPFSAVHAGQGSIHISRIDVSCSSLSDPVTQPPASSQATAAVGDAGSANIAAEKFEAALLACQPLAAQAVASHTDMVRTVYTKLAVNCAINPLTALLRCRNGALLDTDHARGLLRSVCSELVAVMGPQLGGRSAEQLLEQVEGVARATGSNLSSMYQDLEAGRHSEVDYISGYVVRLAQREGGAAPTNECLYRLIKAREAVASAAAASGVVAATSVAAEQPA